MKVITQSDSPPRLILDTNLFVAHFFGKDSREIVNLWKEKQAVLLVSEAILGEYREILSRFHFHPQMKPLLGLFDQRYNMEIIPVQSQERLVPDDPEDDKFLHCGLEGHADALVTSDTHLLRLKSFYAEEIPIVKASDFLRNIWPVLQNKK